MKIARSISELPSDKPRKAGFVPTMGALHEGHLRLMREAKAQCGYCITSIFVNPTQFGPGEDFNRYPRQFEKDCELAKSAGVDLVFAPEAGEMFPRTLTSIRVAGIAEVFEGKSRPGHFDGVATVVAKLFHITGASDAYFGLKDLQQCSVLGRMVRDLNIPIELHYQETIREADGLAMSSRNRYLALEHRQIAPKLYQELIWSKREILGRSSVSTTLQQSRDRLCESGFDIDYYELVDLEEWLPICEVSQKSAIVTAAKIGDTRLIDNVIISGLP